MKTLKEMLTEYSRVCLDGGLVLSEKDNAACDKITTEITENKYGCIVYGETGTGKTLIFDMIRKLINPQAKNYFIKMYCLDAVLDFNVGGHSTFRNNQARNVFYDDLGAEDTGYYFGDKVNVMEKLIQFRYDLWKSQGVITHFSTNLSPEELQIKYGKRCWSRLIEMCKHVSINDGDKRNMRNFIGLKEVKHVYNITKEEKEFNEMYEKHRKNCENMPQPDFKGGGVGSRLRNQLNELYPDKSI